MKRVLAAALITTSLAGCSFVPAGDKRWVSNSQERMFARIPKTWQTFTTDPYKVDSERPKPLQRSTSRWSLVFDSAKGATEASSEKHLTSSLPRNLVGEMSVTPLSADWETGDTRATRELASVSRLRNYIAFETDGLPIDTDPVKDFLDGSPSVEVVSYEEIAKKNGLRGIRLRANFKVDGDNWITIEQRALVDRDTRKLYRLVMKCESSCFKRNYSEVKRISNSWTIKK